MVSVASVAACDARVSRPPYLKKAYDGTTKTNHIKRANPLGSFHGLTTDDDLHKKLKNSMSNTRS
jgi:hypothetical protein